MSESPHHTRLPAALYVVATPIGNLGDITLRALDTLKQVDRVAAEDTRVSGGLLAHFNISQPLVSIREHNEREAANKVIAWITAGEAVAYVSDAGTPAVSDPGARLVAAVRAAGLNVVPIPGASAVTAALSAAGVENPEVAPASFVLSGPTPNPFVSLTNVVFGLPVEGGRVTMEVFDISGRQVRTIETPRLNGGFHRITWDGRNDEGIDVSPGTYFCRVSCGSWSATAKTQLVR